MKIYDCFYFFDELDLAEIRFNILDSVVDYFVVSESDTSFAGKPKSLIFKENISRYDKWKDKIIYHNPIPFPNDKALFDEAMASPNTGRKEPVWLNEYCQKESLIKELKNCSDDDIIFISDLDEVWNPKIKIEVINDSVYKPVLNCHPFYLDNRSDLTEGWTGTRFSNYKTVKKYGLNHIRTESIVKSVPVENGGWHFTWLNRKKNKWADSYPDNDWRLNNYTTSRMWKEKDENLPEYIVENREKYKHLCI